MQGSHILKSLVQIRRFGPNSNSVKPKPSSCRNRFGNTGDYSACLGFQRRQFAGEAQIVLPGIKDVLEAVAYSSTTQQQVMSCDTKYGCKPWSPCALRAPVLPRLNLVCPAVRSTEVDLRRVLMLYTSLHRACPYYLWVGLTACWVFLPVTLHTLPSSACTVSACHTPALFLLNVTSACKVTSNRSP